MNINKFFTRLVVLLLSCLALTVFAGPDAVKISADRADTAITVPLGGNAWRIDKDTSGGNISNKGIVNWTKKKAGFAAYVRLAKKGNFKLWLNLKVPAGTTVLTVTALNETKEVILRDDSCKDNYVGEWAIKDTGYAAIKIRAISKTGNVYADISCIKLSGSAINKQTAWVKNNEGDFFYWGRRGPSVHLSYQYPEKENVEWFYNEVTVPLKNDILGSYFMACGFGEGYFGMQVNSPAERRILFSVWSPFITDDQKKIPGDQKIKMLKKGPGVHTGEFGSEGSGGQSYLLYNWKAGNTYGFLVQAKPIGNNTTTYTAWFFARELNKWQLIASFSRPQTSAYLKHLHSFLENFDPGQGAITRKVYFNNAWIANENGRWTELVKARFTCDNTGAKGYRMDYAGGVDGKFFYLKNCGFFNNYTLRNSVFERVRQGKAPDVELDKLP